MKRTLLAAAALTFASLASAVTVTIDNFDSPTVGPLTAALGTSAAFSDAVRFGSITTIAGPDNGNGASLLIGSGTFPRAGLLEVGNADSRDSEISINWNLLGGLLPTNATNIRFSMQVVSSDGNPTSLDFTIAGLVVPRLFIDRNTKNTDVEFSLTSAQAAAASAGGVLGLRINGDVGWDMTLDSIGFSYDVPPTRVPEPTSLALVGLALAAAGVASRRKA